MRTLQLIVYTTFVMLPSLASALLTFAILVWRDWCNKHFAWTNDADARWQKWLK